MNPGFNYTFGLLIDGFDSPPTFLMTYNPPYYAQLLTEYGYEKAQDFYAYWGHRDMLPGIRAKLQPLARQVAERLKLQVRPLDRTHFFRDVNDFLDIYNQAMASHWGFDPMSAAEIKKAAAGLKWLMEPRLALAAEIDGRRVGVVFAMLDYNPRIKKSDGRLFPLGWLRLLWNRRGIKSIRVVSAAVVPEYHLHGVGLVLIDSLAPAALDWEIEEAEFSWVAESNFLSRGSLEKGGAELKKTYRVYEWK
jgi:GNAT superfamily N-acetyltransferase